MSIARKSTFRMTRTYDLLLHGSRTVPYGVYPLHLATAEQLCRLHYSPASIKLVKKRLKVLVDHGYLYADTIPTKNFKAPYFYSLTAKGMHYLDSIGLAVHQAGRPGKGGGRHALFVEHTLELNDILISAFQVHRVNQSYALQGLTHERHLQRTPYKTVWEEKGKRMSFGLIPDAYLKFSLLATDGVTRSLPILLEHDRGTEQQLYFRRKVRAYIALLKAGHQEQLFGVKSMTIAFTTFFNVNRVNTMRQWTRLELEATNEPEDMYFHFAFAYLQPPLHPLQVWFAPVWVGPHKAEQWAVFKIA